MGANETHTLSNPYLLQLGKHCCVACNGGTVPPPCSIMGLLCSTTVARLSQELFVLHSLFGRGTCNTLFSSDRSILHYGTLHIKSKNELQLLPLAMLVKLNFSERPKMIWCTTSEGKITQPFRLTSVSLHLRSSKKNPLSHIRQRHPSSGCLLNALKAFECGARCSLPPPFHSVPRLAERLKAHSIFKFNSGLGRS